MSRVHWRWSEKDFGFRFKSGGGKSKSDFYQASEPGAFYTVPAKHRKLSKERVDELAAAVVAPTSPRVVPIPWQQYEREWDWITTTNGILLNFAGCLDQEEIHRREDEGVARAMDLVASYLDRAEPVALTTSVIQHIHLELMGAIYPFAGMWRTVSLHKGEGPTKWPLPPGGIDPQMNVLERDVLSRSPLISDDDREVFGFVAEVMGEFLAIHPFREGNGRTAFIIGNLLLMQNDMLPLDVYDRHADEARYYAACEDARIRRNYQSLATLIAEWQQSAQARWEARNGH
jgi:cell filamentation protein